MCIRDSIIGALGDGRSVGVAVAILAAFHPTLFFQPVKKVEHGRRCPDVYKRQALACRLGQALQNATHFEVATGDPRPFGFSVHIVLRTMRCV